MNKDVPNHAVKAVIRNNFGEVLFLRRNAARGAKDNWDLPGGLVESGETDEKALAREISEELGVTANVKSKVGEWSFFRPYDEKTVAVTNYEVVLNEGEIVLSDEHVDYKYYSDEKLRTLEVKDPSIFNALIL